MEEDDGEEDNDDVLMPKKKKARSIFIQDEAERGSDDEEEDDSDDEEEEQDAEKNEYVEDDFVVGGNEEDDEEGKKEEEKRRRKTYERLQRGSNMLLDAEDLELIAENALQGQKPFNEERNEIDPERVRSRSRKVVFNEDDEEEGGAGGGSGLDGMTTTGEGDDSEDSEGEEGEEGGFEDAEERRGGRRKGGREMGAYSRGYGGNMNVASGPSREQMMEAAGIFGDDYDDFDDEEDELAHEAEDEEEKEEGYYRSSRSGQDQTQGGRELSAIRAQYEHSELIESFCTEADEVLRKVDYPERMVKVVGNKPVVRAKASEEERKEEAEWIAERLISEGKAGEGFGDELRPELLSSIVSVLGFIQVEEFFPILLLLLLLPLLLLLLPLLLLFLLLLFLLLCLVLCRSLIFSFVRTIVWMPHLYGLTDGTIFFSLYRVPPFGISTL